MGPILPGGMSFTVNRVPFGGGAVPSMRAPMSSAFSPTEISAGARSVHQIRVEMPPDFEVRLLIAGPSIKTFAVWFAPCPVTTRRIGGYPSLAPSQCTCLAKCVTNDPVGIGTVSLGSNLLPVATHQVPLITVMKRSFG